MASALVSGARARMAGISRAGQESSLSMNGRLRVVGLGSCLTLDQAFQERNVGASGLRWSGPGHWFNILFLCSDPLYHTANSDSCRKDTDPTRQREKSFKKF